MDSQLSVSLTPFSPGQLLVRLGLRARRRRLALALTRPALAAASGVPESSIKRFEACGEIGTRALVMLLAALGQGEQIEALFAVADPRTVDDLLQPERQRGLRADAGRRRRP